MRIEVAVLLSRGVTWQNPPVLDTLVGALDVILTETLAVGLETRQPREPNTSHAS